MKRAGLLIKCNDLVVNDVAVIPEIFRLRRVRRGEEPACLADRLGQRHGNIADWYKDETA